MSHKIWGGRFSDAPDAIMQDINASIDFDKRLYAHDIAGSRAHCSMLAACGIISTADAASLKAGLDKIEAAIASGAFEFKRQFEDIHMNIEAALADMVGEAAGRLHTARSRNDQVATDFRLYLRDAIDTLLVQLRDLQLVFVKRAKAHADVIMPGFTHMQPAQPISYGHYLLAYVEMFARDAGRLVDARTRLNASPLGAAALAGTSFPIDRFATARELGFSAPMANSLDAVSARDFVLEVLSAFSILATHLSRLAEEIVLFSSPAYGFLTLSDGFSTGSSIMPQKRNPDAAELIRGKAGRIIGALTGLFVVMKGLPLAYSKDMQEDKEGVFDSIDNLGACLIAMRGMVETMAIDEAAMAQAAGDGYSTATDLADWLVRVLGFSFRNAHHITGALVALAEARGVALDALSLPEMQAVEAGITAAVYDVLSPSASLASRVSYGGSAPDLVRAAADKWLSDLEDMS